MISLIHPSRGRPEKAKATYIKWVGSAVTPIDYILSLDSSEPCKFDYIQNNVNFIVNDNRSAVDAINNAAKEAAGDILIVISDDFDCPPDWDVKLLEYVKGKTDWIAKTPDGIQKWIITLPIMDRIYYNRFGYIYHPDYLHMFCDTELTAVADLTGRKIELNIPFVHNHYSTGKTVKDEVSIRADKTWEQGERTFIQRAVKHFDLKETPGKITSPDYVNYLRSKGIRI